MKITIFLLAVLATCWAQDGTEKWGYVDVRQDAHMFWWLYYSTHAGGYQTRPLIMWLQGGPGASSTGYGNFEIIGPLDLDLNPRNTTWVQEANILFVDNPVGAGYSYCDTDECFTTDHEQIASDLMALYTHFLNDNPEFESVPFYIFGQSYGGKMASLFALRLHEAEQAGQIRVNLKGFAMGNAWFDPLEATMTWAPFLLSTSITDERGHNAIMAAANDVADAISQGQWVAATNLWRITQSAVNIHTNYVDFYNILKFRVFSEASEPWFEFLVNPSSTNHPDKYDALDDLMNGPIKEYLGVIPQNVIWGAQRSTVFQKQEGDFMKGVQDVVETVLNDTTMEVIIYQGQLDLICDTPGAMNFVQKLQWQHLDQYNNAPRDALVDPADRQTELFVKEFQNFHFYWNQRAGHAVPKDQGGAALRMLQRITNN